MSDLVGYELDGRLAVVTIDDGKANAITHEVLEALGEALDRAEEEAAAVLLVGRPGRFSAGFDLKVMTAGVEGMRDLVVAGARLAVRLFTVPMPVVAACTGHALARGSIILLACDARVGADGPFKVGLTEVAIGMPLPDFAVQLARYRMPPSQFDSALLGRTFAPVDAVAAGYLDRVVAADEVVADARREAAELATLEPRVVGATKRRARGDLAEAILTVLAADMAAVTPPPA